MAEFISWKSYFDFAGEVGYARRYVWSRSTHAFLDAIRDTAPEQVFEVDATDGFWRAVNAVSQPQDIAEAVLGWIRPCPPDRIKPLRLRAHEGRVNPKGIPCLYTATDPTTAISELDLHWATILPLQGCARRASSGSSTARRRKRHSIRRSRAKRRSGTLYGLT